ncbi:MAG: hypothetical protein ACK4QW_04765 [Alphaproteobacteria bacterium]
MGDDAERREAGRRDGVRKDAWDRFAIISGFIAAVLVPLSIGMAGHWYTAAIADREASLKEEQFAREWVQIALDILRTPGAPEQERLNRWAVQVVNHYMPAEIHIEETLQEDLATGRTRIPEVRSGLGRVERMEAMQSAALAALLERDIDGAIAQMEAAHGEWHDFRTVWETLRLLRARRPALAAGAGDAAWRDLYRELVRTMDMRGVPAELRARLRGEP